MNSEMINLIISLSLYTCVSSSVRWVHSHMLELFSLLMIRWDFTVATAANLMQEGEEGDGSNLYIDGWDRSKKLTNGRDRLCRHGLCPSRPFVKFVFNKISPLAALMCSFTKRYFTKIISLSLTIQLSISLGVNVHAELQIVTEKVDWRMMIHKA